MRVARRLGHPEEWSATERQSKVAGDPSSLSGPVAVAQNGIPVEGGAAAGQEPARRWRVLVIDDAPGIQQLLEVGLTSFGFDVVGALDGPEGLARFLDQRPDAVVVDVLMPGMDGYELCRRLRELSDVPIIMLSALRNEPEIIRGLDAGADDYVTKPFSVGELVARLRAHLRRRQRAELPQHQLVFDGGALVIDLDRHAVHRDGREAHVSPTEFRVLAYLAANAGRVVTHAELVGQIWGTDAERLGPYLKIYIRRLRQKIERDPSRPRFIRSRPGAGYLFEPHGLGRREALGGADDSPGSGQAIHRRVAGPGRPMASNEDETGDEREPE